MYWSAQYNGLFQPPKHITSIDLVQQCLCQISKPGTPYQDSSCCLLLDITALILQLFLLCGIMDACSQFFCCNSFKQVLFVNAEAFEDFSEISYSSGSNWTLLCWHTREKLDKYIYTHLSVSSSWRHYYISSINLETLDHSENDRYSIHQIGEFRYGAKHKFTRRCPSVSST